MKHKQLIQTILVGMSLTLLTLLPLALLSTMAQVEGKASITLAPNIERGLTAIPSTLDPDFAGGDGIATGFFQGESGTVGGVDQDNQGHIMIGGETGTQNNGNFVNMFSTLRMSSTGELDLNFAGTDLIGDGSIGNDIAVQENGDTIVVGHSFDSSFNRSMAATRFSQDGTVDQNFLDELTGSFNGQSSATSVIIQPDGKNVIAGSAQQDQGSPEVIALVRGLSDGVLDVSFADDGILTATFDADENSRLNSVAIQDDDKIVAAGRSGPSNGDGAIGVVRFNPDGSSDGSFGDDGAMTVPINNENSEAFDLDLITGPISHAAQTGNTVARQGSERKIILAGESGGNMLVMRLNDDGTLDTTFGTNGSTILTIGSGNSRANAVDIQVNGKIVVAGQSADENGIVVFTVARLNSDGTPDTSFNNGSHFVTTPLGTGSFGDIATDLFIQDDGKIVVAGHISDFTQFAVVRYLGDPINSNPTNVSLADFEAPYTINWHMVWAALVMMILIGSSIAWRLRRL